MTNEELAVMAKTGDIESANKIYEAVNKLLFLFAYRFYIRNSALCKRTGAELDDLKQAAYLAMLDAIDKYAPEREYAFNSYLPICCRNRFHELCGTNRKRNPLDFCGSLDEPLKEGENELLLGDTLPDERAEKEINDVAERDYNEHRKRDISRALSLLPKDEREIIRKLYWQHCTVSQAGEAMGLEEQSARRLYEHAIRDLRRYGCRRYLDQYSETINKAYRGSVQDFKRTWTSATEYTALKLIDIGQNRTF